MEKKRVHIIVEGRVQGVFFRVNASNLAKSLGIKGWVKNRFDKKVELVAEGEESSINKFIEWCRKGPPGAIVTNIDIMEEPYSGEFDDFVIRY